MNFLLLLEKKKNQATTCSHWQCMCAAARGGTFAMGTSPVSAGSAPPCCPDPNELGSLSHPRHPLSPCGHWSLQPLSLYFRGGCAEGKGMRKGMFYGKRKEKEERRFLIFSEKCWGCVLLSTASHPLSLHGTHKIQIFVQQLGKMRLLVVHGDWLGAVGILGSAWWL